MADQKDLFTPGIDPPKAPKGRTGPRLWVRRLAIFSDPQTLIREVILKPGLNIVWTPDMASSGSRALAHGSGKTTFCRLLRACLGEPGYAKDTQQKRLKAWRSDGLFAAEILVDGACWVAIRSFGSPGGDRVIQADSIENAIIQDRQPGEMMFIDSLLIKTFFSKIAAGVIPDIASEHIWDILRAWLTRDQECRLADILSWRSSQTQTRSRAQTIGETAKLTMVRLALRALDSEERAALIHERELEAAVEQERHYQAYRQRRYDDSLKAVRAALHVDDDVGFDDTIEQKGLISMAEAVLADAMRTVLPKPPDVGAIFARYEEVNDEYYKLSIQHQNLKNDIRLDRDRAEHCRSEANLGEDDITQGRIRRCSICRVQVDEVLAKGCGISLERCDLPKIRAEIADKQQQANVLDAKANAAEQEAKHIAALIQQIESRKQRLEAEVKAADDANHAAQTDMREVQGRVYQARRNLDDVKSLHEIAKNGQPAASTGKELDMVRAQLATGRLRARAAIRTLEERYQGIMTAWLPEGITGTIKLDGNGLKVDAEFSGRGEVSASALDSLKIVAFDLAALHMAAEEKADLPAFLMHDSPREADLDGQLYADLFRLVHQWEAAGTPCFQYIITTTTAPPKELQRDDFTRLRMSSSPPEERLFRKDI